MDITYKIQFYSQWHCGSGLSAGADVDNLVVKDSQGMPFVPGKTMKGLIREAVEDYLAFTKAAATDLEKTFGVEGSVTGEAHFGNAVLPAREYNAIVANIAQHYLYNKVTTTAIDENGVARDHSLRSMETVVPCTLEGMITDIPEAMQTVIAGSLGLLKRIGQKRNRGLGRCDVSIVAKGGLQ